MELPARMTAAVLTGHGGPDRLEIRDDVPVPRPARGEVVVRVSAAAVNNTDIWTREGAYGRPGDPEAVAGWKGVPLDFPRIQGADIAGTIAEVGEGVDPDREGARVIVDPGIFDTGPGEPELEEVIGSERDGGFAEFVAVPSLCAVDVSGSPLDDVHLACIPIAYGTAMGMLERSELAPGERLLVTGASGGLGSALVQLGAARGARVTALTSSGHEAAVRRAGATDVVLRDDDDPESHLGVEAREGFDVVADVVGGGLFPTVLDMLRAGGRLVTAGAVAGPVVTIDLRRVYLERRRIIGSTMHTPEQFRRLAELVTSGAIHPLVARTYPLAAIAEAQRDLREGDGAGKLVLVP